MKPRSYGGHPVLFWFCNFSAVFRKSLEGNFSVLIWANPGLFLFIFGLFNNNFTENCRLKGDSNLDCQSRRPSCWPLDHHHPQPHVSILVVTILHDLWCGLANWDLMRGVNIDRLLIAAYFDFTTLSSADTRFFLFLYLCADNLSISGPTREH